MQNVTKSANAAETRMTQRPDEGPHEPQTGAERPPGSPVNTGPPTWVAMSGLGFEFVAAVLLPGALGWWLDRKMGTMPWLMLVGGLLGFAIGLRLLMKTVSRPRSK